MKYAAAVTTLLGAASVASAYEAPYDGFTVYTLTDFYAGSGPMSSTTQISFTISQTNATLANSYDSQSCTATSGSNAHDGYIAYFPYQACNASQTANYYGFSFERVENPAGYYLNVTDGMLGYGSFFINNNSVVEVPTGDPSQPNYFPNYQVTLSGDYVFGREQSPPYSREK